MRKVVSLLTVMVLALSVAMPVIASPPGGPPLLEAAALSAGPSIPLFGIQKEAIIGVASPPRYEQTVLFIEPVIGYTVLAAIVYAIYTLAGLMRRDKIASNRLSATSYDPRSRMHALARDQTAAG